MYNDINDTFKKQYEVKQSTCILCLENTVLSI